MKARWSILFLFCLGLSAESLVVSQIHLLSMAGDLAQARQLLQLYQKSMGTTPDYMEGLSWIGRGEFRAKDYQKAEETATEVRRLVLAKLGKGNLDSNASFATALGASIEVQGQVAAATGRRDQAVGFLRAEAARWRSTSIRARIQKTLNLLSLEGKPAPPLETATALTSRKAQPLAKHLGHPILLFFWAHWCIDCKNQVEIVSQLQKKYAARGLQVIAPTQHYGYVAGGEDAPRDIETRYMKAIHGQFYSALGDVEVPVSEENFGIYGVSSTPTMVLIDSAGVVKMYNPGNATLEQLAARIEPLLVRR